MVDVTGLASVAVGDECPPRTYGPLTRTDIVRYAGASGDFNPLHHDDGFAREAGFAGVFSIGMLQAAFLSTYATDWLGATNVRRVAVRFREQVWPGDTLTCAGRVVAVQASEEGSLATVELTCTRQTGAVALVGEASFVIP